MLTSNLGGNVLATICLSQSNGIITFGEENPYRLKWHKVFEQQGAIIVQNWTPDW